MHRDVLGLLDEEWVPRTTLLSPFDNLICDRERTERLWGFTYRNEMYVLKHKRQFGYYVMPVLSGDRLTGRVAVRADRKSGVLVVEGMYAEPGAPPDPALSAAIESLASFAGARLGDFNETSRVLSCRRRSRWPGRSPRLMRRHRRRTPLCRSCRLTSASRTPRHPRARSSR